MDKAVSLEGRGVIPCLFNVGEVHVHKGPPLAAKDLVALLGRAVARHAQLGVAIDNLRRILIQEQILVEDTPTLPHTLLEELRHAIALAQAVVPGAHQEVLGHITRALERIDAYQESLPVRGMA